MSAGNEKFTTENLSQAGRDFLEMAEKMAWQRHASIIALQLHKALRAKGWNKTQLAEALGVKPPMVSRLLRGSENLTLKTLVKLERILDVKLGEAYEDMAPKPDAVETKQPNQYAVQTRPGANRWHQESVYIAFQMQYAINAHQWEIPKLANKLAVSADTLQNMLSGCYDFRLSEKCAIEDTMALNLDNRPWFQVVGMVTNVQKMASYFTESNLMMQKPKAVVQAAHQFQTYHERLEELPVYGN